MQPLVFSFFLRPRAHKGIGVKTIYVVVARDFCDSRWQLVHQFFFINGFSKMRMFADRT
jgi:hypothetical protein